MIADEVVCLFMFLYYHNCVCMHPVSFIRIVYLSMGEVFLFFFFEQENGYLTSGYITE